MTNNKDDLAAEGDSVAFGLRTVEDACPYGVYVQLRFKDDHMGEWRDAVGDFCGARFADGQ